MGQKVNPNGFRFGITKKHNSQWYADKGLYAKYLLEDHKIKKFLETLTRDYAIGKIEILRNQGNKVIVRIHTSKPGLVLGKDNANIDKLTRGIKKATKNHKLMLNIDVIAIEKPELDAKLLAEDIAEKLENRVSYRVAQKWAIRSALRAGAKGIKTRVSGRLNGVEMARTEGYTKGEMRLHTLRQNIDYAQALAKTTYGIIGVKVWISKGEILDGGKK